MKVSVLQVDRCKPILGLNAFDHAPVRQHLERELVQSPVQDSQIQDWPKATTFLGYDEVRAVKPLPHLGWRDRLDCILCQEDSNLLAQDRGVLGRSPGPAAEQKQNETEDSPPGPPPVEGAALFSPSPEKEQTPTSPGCPRQGRFVDFLDDLGPGWDAGGAALLREAQRTGLCVNSAWGGAALEDAGGRPRRRADRGLAPGAAVDGASRRGRMCWIASVCCCTAENCWAKPSTVSPDSPPWEMGASRKRALSTSFISARLSQRWRSWTTMVDIAFPRDRAVTFVARRAKSVAVRSSCINPGSVLPSCTCLSALAW